MNGFILFLIEIVLMFCSIVAYWRTRLKGWLLSTLGFFFLSSGFICTIIVFILELLFPHPIYRFLGLAYKLELYISTILIAIGWGLVFKRNWDKHREKLKEVKPELTTLEACHRLALIEEQKENKNIREVSVNAKN